ncbi:Serine/threonine-protein phosphatase 4 regulatory subunit 4, partial [Physocladia obscura]
GVLKTAGVENYEIFKLDQALSHLSLDQCVEVKRRLTCGFHEIVEILDRQSQYLLRNLFLRLLSDSDIDVYEPLFKNIGIILKGFALDESGRKTAQFDELLFLILRKEREYASIPSQKLTWRIHHSLLQQFKYFIDYFDSEYIHDQCIPLLFKLLSDNITVPIKQTVIETLCIYLRKMRRLENRMKIIRAIAELRESSNCHTRLIFLSILKCLYQFFSHHFLRETFFDEFLEMARDTVANVRLVFVAMSVLFRKSLLRSITVQILQQQQQQQSMPSLSSVLSQFGQYVPQSVRNAQQSQAAALSNITRLNECVIALCGDQDRDVATAAQDELERIGLNSRKGGVQAKANIVTTLGLDDFAENLVAFSYTLTDSEVAEDREREEYEERLLSVEIEEDASTMRSKRDDESGIRLIINGGKRSSISKHSAAKPPASHRRSNAFKPVPKVAAVTAALPSTAMPRTSLANRTNVTHSSWTQLSGPNINSTATSFSESTKRGKSAGSMGKSKSGTMEKISPANSTTTVKQDEAPISESTRKKSMASLVSNNNSGNIKTAPGRVGQSSANNQHKDSLTPNQHPKPGQMSPSAGRNLTIPQPPQGNNRTLSITGTVGAGSGFRGGVSGAGSHAKSSVKQLPPIPASKN